MPKKKNKKSAAAEASAAKQQEKQEQEEKEEDDEEEEIEVEEEVELLQADVGDIIKVKQILDETVVGAIISEDLSSFGETVQLTEEYSHDNLKLFLMTLACSFAAVAQFGLAADFPKNRLWLGVCCAIYFCISGILQLIMTFIDKDCIMITQPLTDPKAIKLVKRGANKEMGKYGIRVRSQFPRFSEYYTVILEFQGKDPPSEFVKKTWSVGQFFDVDGFFDEEGLVIEIEELYQRFESGQFDTPDDESKKKNN